MKLDKSIENSTNFFLLNMKRERECHNTFLVFEFRHAIFGVLSEIGYS